MQPTSSPTSHPQVESELNKNERWCPQQKLSSTENVSTLRDISATNEQQKLRVELQPYPDNAYSSNTTKLDTNVPCNAIKPNLPQSDLLGRLHFVPDDCKKEGYDSMAAAAIQPEALISKDVSYLAFKAVDTNSISGTPSPRKHCSNSNSHSYGASGNFTTANSICTLHAVTDLEPGNVTNSVPNAKDEVISSYSDIRTLTNKPETKSTVLAPSFSIPAGNAIDQLSQNEFTAISGVNDSLQSCDDNPFQNDRLPIWQRRQQFQPKGLDSNAESDTASPSTATSSAVSLCYPPPHANDLRSAKNNIAYSSSSPDNSQIHGYSYKHLNETPTSPELIAYRQQQQQYGTNCLPHLTSNTTNSNFYDPTTIYDIPPPGTPPEVIHVLYNIHLSGL